MREENGARCLFEGGKGDREDVCLREENGARKMFV